MKRAKRRAEGHINDAKQKADSGGQSGFGDSLKPFFDAFRKKNSSQSPIGDGKRLVNMMFLGFAGLFALKLVTGAGGQ